MPTAMEIASTLLGKGEIPDRQTIQQYLKTGGAGLDPATTAWCAAFVNSSLQQAGMKGTGSNLARSFLNYGQAVDQPQKGDLAIFSRGNDGISGHVGFFQGYGPDGKIQVLGGNQGNAVSVAGYDPGSLLGFRRAGEAMPMDAPTQTAQPTSLAANFAPEGFDMGTAIPSLGGLLPKQRKTQPDEQARKQALFGEGGVADMFA